ncbi:alpha-galactosidase [Sandarakinorhabdus sp.]|uniref:alpha-galactosidase n=1 Tax=Sandarakinorhabdus sp. TaxID=1916663 RepID=UPI003342A703
MIAARLACLHGDAWSLVLEWPEGAAPIWRHIGQRTDPAGLPALADVRAPAHFTLEDAPAHSAIPVAGLGWFGPSALALRGADGRALAVAFTAWDVVQTPTSLTITGHDELAGIACTLSIRRTPGDSLECVTNVENRSSQPVLIDHLASAVLPVPAGMASIIAWRGRYNAEMIESRCAMPDHGWQRESRGGLTGHGGPCGAVLLAADAGWHQGRALAVQLAWSGDARLAIERDDDGGHILAAQAVLLPGELVLPPAASHTAPALLLALSDGGRGGVMAAMHAAVRARLAWPGGAMTPRPVHLNSWEACYFAHDEARIRRLANAAAAIGVERFILDDGWFKGRSDDRAGLGDWTPDPLKYPGGLGPVADHVHGLGMQFGLWVEPEMVNPDSDLYRAHPDWVLALPGLPGPTARHQLVLDLRRSDVRAHLFGVLDGLLRSVRIDYLKWDHNRALAPAGGAAQVSGVYALLAQLRAAHPQVEIESCAAGGGRIDAGIAQFTHRFWPSDNVDALARIAIQRGFLAFMPPELMGAHVGASPSHATGRQQPLGFRAAIAAQGHLGVELDPDALEPAARAELAGWIDFWKTWRGVILGGQVVQGEAGDGLLWQAQGGVQGEWLLWVIRADQGSDRYPQPIPLPFAAGRSWQVQLLRQTGPSAVLTPRAGGAFAAMQAAPQRFTGSWLAGAGLPVPALAAHSVLIFHLRAEP